MYRLIGMLIAAILVCGFGFSLASAQDVPITDVKIFAGTWEGYLRGDGGMSSRLTMTVQEDGTYRVQGPGVDAGAGGTITVGRQGDLPSHAFVGHRHDAERWDDSIRG